MKRACVTCALLCAVLSVAGCAPDELQAGMFPQLGVRPPAGNGGDREYWGPTFGVHWDAIGLEVTSGFDYAGLDRNLTTVAGTLWLGWFLTYNQREEHDAGQAWLVARPSAGVYFWNESDDGIGFFLGWRVGFGIHLNEFNTIGLEYGVDTLQDTHANGSTQTDGWYFTYSIVF
jgi:hypothetical protein